MSMMAQLQALMAYSVIVEPFSSDDKYGDESYGTAVTYKAAIERKARMVRNAQGEEVPSATTVYLNMTALITARDRVTLPSDFSPTQPKIITFERNSDQNGLQHTVLFL